MTSKGASMGFRVSYVDHVTVAPVFGALVFQTNYNAVLSLVPRGGNWLVTTASHIFSHIRDAPYEKYDSEAFHGENNSSLLRPVQLFAWSPSTRHSRPLHILWYFARSLNVSIHYKKDTGDNNVNTIVGYSESDWVRMLRVAGASLGVSS